MLLKTEMKLTASRTLMIGDRLDTDIGKHAANFH